MAEEIEGRSFRGEDRSSPPLHGGHDFTDFDRGAFVHVEAKFHASIDQREGQGCRLHTGENTSLPGDDMGASRGIRRDHRSRRGVPTGPEIFVQGTSYDRFDEYFGEIRDVVHAV